MLNANVLAVLRFWRCAC